MSNFSPTNRDNPEMVKFYRDLGDLFRIFWEFHKRRIESGDGFSASQWVDIPDSREKQEQEFSPDELVFENYPRKHLVIERFSDALTTSMHISWQHFLLQMGETPSRSSLTGVWVTERSPTVYDLKDSRTLRTFLNDVKEVAKQQSIMIRRGIVSTFDELVETGIATGALIATQTTALKNIMDERYQPEVSGIMISKISNSHTLDAVINFGIPVIDRRFRAKVRYPDFKLVEPGTKHGLDVALLQKYGYGAVLGCPFSMKSTNRARDYLKREYDMPDVPHTATEELIVSTQAPFEKYVGEWYRELSDSEKERFVDPYDRALLEGQMPLELMERLVAKGFECPYPSNRERM